MLFKLRSVDAPPMTSSNGALLDLRAQLDLRDREIERDVVLSSAEAPNKAPLKNCATVEEMGEVFKGMILSESLRVRRIIQRHFSINGNQFFYFFIASFAGFTLFKHYFFLRNKLKFYLFSHLKLQDLRWKITKIKAYFLRLKFVVLWKLYAH